MFAELAPGRAVTALLLLFVLAAVAIVLFATLTMRSAAPVSDAPSVEAPAPREVNCWHSPVC